MNSATDSSGQVRDVRTPLADALLRVTALANGSMHALPLSGGLSIAGSAFRDRYLSLFGEAYLTAEVSYSGAALDSFFRPRGCIADAQRLAARAFGADETLFVTGGTTLANTIGLDAAVRLAAHTAVERPVRVLVDRTCHQSIHFGLNRPGVATVYCAQRHCGRRERTWADIEDLIDQYQAAAAMGEPFDLVVLSASGYDGGKIDVHGVLVELLRCTDSVTVLVDEAWGAIQHFHPQLKWHTALAAAARVRAEFPDKRLRMLVTHSAHKSMSALRQGSYLHVAGDTAIREMVRASLYRHHTTSPSLPVLASLDLARAQAEVEGAELVERSLAQARTLRELVTSDPSLRLFSIIDPAWVGDRWLRSDPTKVLLGVDTTAISPKDVQLRLIRDHGLYVSHTPGSGLLLHLHIGVTPEVFDRLLRVLREITAALTPPDEDCLPSQFVIAYPPGIPIAVPGERHDTAAARHEGLLRHTNAELFRV